MPATARASLAFYNTYEEVDVLVEALHKVIEVFKCKREPLMSYFNELYQQVILDHNKRPRNFGELPEADRKAEGHNPLCGDRVTVYLKIDGRPSSTSGSKARAVPSRPPRPPS